ANQSPSYSTTVQRLMKYRPLFFTTLMVQQILFLFKSPGWLLMALLTPTLPLSLYFLILLIMRDPELLPISANLDLTFFVLTDLTFFLRLRCRYNHSERKNHTK